MATLTPGFYSIEPLPLSYVASCYTDKYGHSCFCADDPRIRYYWGEPERAPQLGDQRRLTVLIYIYTSRVLASRTLWLHYPACASNYSYATYCTVYSVQCTCVTRTWIRPTKNDYGRGESGRETNVPPKHKNVEKNG